MASDGSNRITVLEVDDAVVVIVEANAVDDAGAPVLASAELVDSITWRTE